MRWQVSCHRVYRKVYFSYERKHEYHNHDHDSLIMLFENNFLESFSGVWSLVYKSIIHALMYPIQRMSCILACTINIETIKVNLLLEENLLYHD